MKHMKWIIGLALVLLLAVGLTIGAMADPAGPTAKEGPFTYNGSDQVLFNLPVDAGEYGVEGKYYYALGFSKNIVYAEFNIIPPARNAGTYTLYWAYQTETDEEGNRGFDSVCTYPESVTISPSTVTVDTTKVSSTSFTYSGSNQKPAGRRRRSRCPSRRRRSRR